MKVNRICNYCGREYYCCRSCISINSWKNTCCSVNCYREMIKTGLIWGPQEINREVGETMKIVLRAGLNNNTTIDITGYDLELGRFDCSDGKTREYDDFEYFIVPRNELQDIVKYFEDKAKKTEVPKYTKLAKKKEEDVAIDTDEKE